MLLFQAILSPNAMQELDRSKNYSKMTKTLLAILFERATLQKSSFTGKGGGEILDPTKVKLITGKYCIYDISFKFNIVHSCPVSFLLPSNHAGGAFPLTIKVVWGYPE